MAERINLRTTVETKLYVLDCANCGIVFAITEDFEQRRRADGAIFYCPSGHNQSWHESENDKIRRERDKLKQDAARLQENINFQREQREVAERQARAYKGVATKLKKRALGGVCPCCSRSFSALSRHIATQHPEYKSAEIIPMERAS